MNTNKTVQNIAIGAIIVALIAGIAFVLSKSNLLSRFRGTNNQQIVENSPLPTSDGDNNSTNVRNGSPTPFPRLTFGSPLPSGSATPTTTAIPTNSQCGNLVASPSEGVAPLTTRFSATSIAQVGQIKEYEFNFGDGTQAIKQASSTINHKYEQPGVYIASLKARDQQGNIINFTTSECRRSVSVKEKPSATTTGSTTSNLPKTGFPLWTASLISVLALVSGLYLVKHAE